MNGVTFSILTRMEKLIFVGFGAVDGNFLEVPI